MSKSWYNTYLQQIFLAISNQKYTIAVRTQKYRIDLNPKNLCLIIYNQRKYEPISTGENHHYQNLISKLAVFKRQSISSEKQ